MRKNISDICINKRNVPATCINMDENIVCVTELLHTMFYTISGGGFFS